MYYAHFILNKKGPLAKIWLAAHWDKKLTKAQIYETNIESTIETILEPQMKLALRTSGHLLLGVCRIYSRKVKYLLADCNEAFVKIKLAFRPGLIDLPKEKQQASAEAITLPEKFPEFYVNFNDINIEDIDMSKNLAQQQARVEDITLKDDFGTFVTMQEDDFGDMGSFGMGMGLDMDTFMMSDMEKGRRFGESLLNNDQNEVDFFDDRLNNQSDFASVHDLSKQQANNNNNNDIQPMELNDLNVNPIDSSGFNSKLDNLQSDLTQNDTIMQDFQEHENNEMTNVEVPTGVVPTLFDDQPTVNNTNLDEPAEKVQKLDDINEEENLEKQNDSDKVNKNDSLTDNNENIDSNKQAQPTVVVEKQIKARRRRKLIIDDVKEIDSNTMKSQLGDTSAISGSLELAPPTRKLMQWKETGGVDKLFSMTSRPIHNKGLTKLYTRNMVTKSLVDITNSSRLDKTIVKDTTIIASNATINHEMSIEASMNDNQMSKNVLPLADSFIDNNLDISKQNQLNEISVDKSILNGIQPNELDEIDQLGGPRSIYNSNLADDLLMSDYQANQNLEVTPNKDDKKKEDKKLEIDSSDEDDDLDDTKKSSKNKASSPSHKKRQYRRTLNLTSNKDMSLKDDEEFDDTLSNDPSKNLTKRAKTMVSILNKSFNKNDNIGFFEIIKKNSRKNAVQKFYSLLVLTKYEIIEVSQEDQYDDIIISKGEKFETFAIN